MNDLAPPRTLDGLRVLIVEDEPLIAMMLEDILTDLGGTPLGPASTIEAALSLAEAGDFDVALLDLNLNGTRSDPVAERLIELARPFVVTSGYTSISNPAAFDVPFVRKPYKPEQIAEAIQAATRMHPPVL